MKHVVCNGLQKKKLKMYLVLILVVVTMINNVKITQASNNRDYLKITLADIIITWYNASGTAIGNQQLFNAIQSAYGNITLEDLVDNDVIVTTDITATKEDIKTAIGYGSYSVPYLKVNHRNLMQYCGGLPTDDIASESLTAMFSWTNNPTLEGIFSAISIAVGNVVNLGKIGYNFTKDVLVDTLNNIWLVNTLKDVYHNFTDSTYFQNYIHSTGIGTSSITYNGWTIINPPNGYSSSVWACQYMGTNINAYVIFPQENVYLAMMYIGNGTKPQVVICNANNVQVSVPYKIGTFYINDKTIDLSNGTVSYQSVMPLSIRALGYDTKAYNYTESIGYAVGIIDNTQQSIIANNPWGNMGASTVSDYMNDAVGNLTEINYQDQTSNVTNGEYMYVIDKSTYQYIMGDMISNTNNGQYAENGDIINNYNTTYIQPSTETNERPTMAPAPSGQPVQPFISPRPTPIPEETDSAIYNGGISESIKDKFPFCIPWDIQAMINNLWSSERRAPYIHWDANFGSWGKLGEVDIDLSPYDTAAAIFRSTTLLLWIIGLVLITRNIIGS